LWAQLFLIAPATANTLAKMANLSANSLIGNNTESSATPLALSAAQVKTLLSLNNVENTALSTWTGSSNLTTVGAFLYLDGCRILGTPEPW